jgi:hypothetical protein
VSIHRVEFELTPASIKNELLDNDIYKGTEYLILNNNGTWAVVRVGKTPKRSLFWLVIGVEIISLPDDTVFIKEPTADVLNLNMMSELAKKYPGKTVVVQGKFEHVSFIVDEEPVELNVLDVKPPEPVKLINMVEYVLDYKSFSKPIKINENIIDITSMVEDAKTDIIILPCQATEFGTDKKILYLDERPELESYDKKEITLIGCDLSLKIFRELYRFTPGFINICPVNLAENLLKSGPVLVKCCKVKGFERDGNLFQVPWGVTYSDLENALREFVSD